MHLWKVKKTKLKPSARAEYAAVCILWGSVVCFCVHLNKYLCEVAPLESGMKERPKNGLKCSLLKESNPEIVVLPQRLWTSVHY